MCNASYCFSIHPYHVRDLVVLCYNSFHSFFKTYPNTILKSLPVKSLITPTMATVAVAQRLNRIIIIFYLAPLFSIYNVLYIYNIAYLLISCVPDLIILLISYLYHYLKSHASKHCYEQMSWSKPNIFFTSVFFS